VADRLSRLKPRLRLTGQMRFLRFNGVGVVGFALQLGVLTLLLGFGVHYLLATALAVESAVLNNFFWHERWTWRDRPVAGRGRVVRLFRFHALNGLVSLVGNVLLMRLFVGSFGVPPIPANIAAVLACSLVNYFGSDRIVFRTRFASPSEASAPRTSACRSCSHPSAASASR
jgi:dolichol-phosphate mannosyltransferase